MRKFFIFGTVTCLMLSCFVGSANLSPLNDFETTHQVITSSPLASNSETLLQLENQVATSSPLANQIEISPTQVNEISTSLAQISQSGTSTSTNQFKTSLAINQNKTTSPLVNLNSSQSTAQNSVNLENASIGEIYYRIVSENAILYRAPLESTESSNVYFCLPATYFVRFNSTFDEKFLNVTYRDFTGYVLADDVERVYSTPLTPFANQTFSVQGIANLVLRSEPTTSSEYIGTIPFNATDIEFFGAIEGEQANSELSNLWYFCRYTSFEQGILTGYVYAPLTNNLTPLEPNTEIVETEPSAEVNTDGVLAPELQSGTSFWLIIGLTIRALLLLLLVLKPGKNRKNKVAKRQIANLNKLSLPDKTNKDEFDF